VPRVILGLALALLAVNTLLARAPQRGQVAQGA